MSRVEKRLRLSPEAVITSEASNWRPLYQLARSEKDPRKQQELCDRARRLIQERSLELAEDKIPDPAEENALNDALRELWKLQNRT